jgi:hypothetical protein
MPALPQLSGRETVQAFESLGWKVVRQKREPYYPDQRWADCDVICAKSQGSRQGDFTQSTACCIIY